MTEWCYLVLCQKVTISQEERTIKKIKKVKEYQRLRDVYVSEGNL